MTTWRDVVSWVSVGIGVLAWLVLGSGRRGVREGDRVDDRGTWALAVAGTLAGLVLAAASLIAVPTARIPVPEWLLRTAGGLMTLSGALLRQWAVHTLGRLFTQLVMIRPGHQVVTGGPYAVLRHPAYTGTVLSIAGLAVVLGNWLGVVLAVTVTVAGHLPRIRAEERALEAALGEQYAAYARDRKRLVPGIW